MKTVISWLGHSIDGLSLEDLFELLAKHPLARRFEAYGEYLEPPVWSEPNSEWAADGSDGEFMFDGNFHDLSCSFCLATNDPALIERIRAAVEINRARPDFLEQPPVPLSLGILAGYIRDLGISCPRWEGDTEMPERTTIVLRDGVDDERVECQLQHDGAVVDYVCNRHALKVALVMLARTRRPELGFSISDILGPIVDPQPGTLAAALGTAGHDVAHRDINSTNEAGQLELL